MKLTQKQQLILAEVQFEARKSHAEVARTLGIRTNTVSDFLALMKSQKLLKPWVVVDTRRLGYFEYGLRFEPIGLSADKRASLEKFLVNYPGVGAAGLYATPPSIGMLLYAKSAHEVDNFMSELSRVLPYGSMTERAFNLRSWWVSFADKYLVQTSSGTKSIGWEREFVPVETDELDLNIVRLLSHEPELSNTEMAGRLKVPRSTLEHRMRRLQQKGVIIGFVYFINSQHFGNNIFRCIISGQFTEEDTEELYKFSLSHPYITRFVRCMGACDFELRIDTPTLAAGAAVRHEIMERFTKSVSTVTLLPFVRNLKVGFNRNISAVAADALSRR